MRYYYLVASLPMLRLRQVPQITVETLLESCERQLSPTHYAEFRILAQDIGFVRQAEPVRISNFTEQCIQYRRSLYAALVAYKKLPEDYEQNQLVWEIAMRVSISQAFVAAEKIASENNPYRSEILFMRSIWQFITQLEAPYAYAFENVLAYAVKLWLVYRRNNMTNELGEEHFLTVHNQVMMIS